MLQLGFLIMTYPDNVARPVFRESWIWRITMVFAFFSATFTEKLQFSLLVSSSLELPH